MTMIVIIRSRLKPGMAR